MARLAGRALPVVIAAVEILHGRVRKLGCVDFVETGDVDRVEVAADRLHVTAAERPYAAMLAEQVVCAATAELVIGKVLLARKHSHVRRLGERRPEPSLGTDRAVALAGADRKIEIGFKPDLAAMAASFVCLFHSPIRLLISAAVSWPVARGWPRSNSRVRASEPTTTGSNPASFTKRCATASASVSSPPIGIAMRSGVRLPSFASDAAGMQLKARTTRVPRKSSAVATPAPLRCASRDIGP